MSEYTVQAGDTLWAIAETHLGDPVRWPEIARLSGLADPDLIRVGQVLQIPDGDEAADAADASKSARASSWGASAAIGVRPAVLPLPSGWWISSPFGPRSMPGYPPHHHDGVDIAIPSGTPLPALSSGRVTIAGDIPGYGGVVEVATSDGSGWRYAHCRQLLVQVDQQVWAGNVVALSGGGPTDPHRGMSTGAHLHLETRQGGVLVDPLTLIRVRDAG